MYKRKIYKRKRAGTGIRRNKRGKGLIGTIAQVALPLLSGLFS